MAKLQELRTMIDAGEEVVLFLPHNHPGNEENKNLMIFISRDIRGLYKRKLSYTDRSISLSPRSTTYTWDDLVNGSNGVEATSDQWTHYKPNEVNETLKERWLEESRDFRLLNKYEEALTAIEEAISLDPTYVQAYVEKGIIYRDRPFELTDADIIDFGFGSKRVSDEAIALFEKAIQLDPTYAQAYVEMAVTYAQNAHYEEALLAIEKVIQLDPTYVQAYVEKGIIYRKKPCKPFEWKDDYVGDYDEAIALANYNEAIASFEKAIQIDPIYAQAYYEMTTTYYNNKRL